MEDDSDARFQARIGARGVSTGLVEAPAQATECRGRIVAEGVNEAAWAFECATERLLGVLSTPAAGVDSTGIAFLITVGGPQYRVGAHRQFVQLARALARRGHTVLRFDQRGMGDSEGAQRGFEDITADIFAAVGAVRTRLRSVRRVVLFGLCDGAAAALLCLREGGGPAIDGLCLLNPWVRSEATLARTHLKHYYGRRLFEPTFWRKLLAGGVGGSQWRGLLTSWRLTRGVAPAATTDAALPFQYAMARAWQCFDGPVLLLLSEDDLTAREFTEHAQTAPEWRGLLQRPTVRQVRIEGADHTLSGREAQARCEAEIIAWLSATATGVWRAPS